MKSLLSKFAGLAAVALLIAAPVLADSPQTGTLEGQAVDAAGGPLPGVTVTLTS